jgi:hypothetical protein
MGEFGKHKEKHEGGASSREVVIEPLPGRVYIVPV